MAMVTATAVVNTPTHRCQAMLSSGGAASVASGAMLVSESGGQSGGYGVFTQRAVKGARVMTRRNEAIKTLPATRGGGWGEG